MASTASSTMSTLTNSNRTMTTFAPSTPKRQSSTALTPRTTPSQIDRSQQGSPKPSNVTPNTTPGRWTHPRYDEVLHRQNARTFTDKRAKQILYNSAALAATFFLTSVVIPAQWIQALAPDVPGFYNALSWTILILRLLFTYNTLEAALRSFSPPDTLSDIPLTPDQRTALNLPPTSSTPTVAAASSASFVTPPRYAKASGGSPANSRTGTPTPTTPRVNVLPTGSPVGPGQNSSSLSASLGTFQSPMGASTSRFGSSMGFGDSGSHRRGSFGSPSPKGTGLGGSGGMGSIIGNSVSGSNPSVTASGKWLFEQKQRRGAFGAF